MVDESVVGAERGGERESPCAGCDREAQQSAVVRPCLQNFLEQGAGVAVTILRRGIGAVPAPLVCVAEMVAPLLDVTTILQDLELMSRVASIAARSRCCGR